MSSIPVGKPISDSTYSRNQLQAWLLVRKGKVIHQWVRRLCVVTGTRLLIYRDKNKATKPTTVQLAKGAVEEVQFKGHDYCLKLTSSQQGDRSVYFSFSSESEYSKWLIKLKKGTTKLPTRADLSNCHLEFLPETVFINDELKVLNLRHNILKERPIEEDIYTIGWLDDLPRFVHLRSLNLADNELGSFPLPLCKLRTLEELNLATNKISEIPPEISELANLQVLHVHNNHLTNLPVTMVTMNHLSAVVIAFNHFTTVPNVLLKSTDSQLHTDSLIMAGNLIEKLTSEVLTMMKKIRKIDLRLNKLLLPPSETAKFQSLDHVTHMDIRDNQIQDLDLRCLKSLEYLNCERNKIKCLQISGNSIKRLHAASNELESISVSIKPEWLITLDLSQNNLTDMPQWISDCFFLVTLNVSHNKIRKLPEKLFVDPRKLQVLNASCNGIIDLPEEFVDGVVIEEIHIENNKICYLPKQLFIKCNKLRYLNATRNRLDNLPDPHQNVSLNKIQELYLSFNKLNNEGITAIACFTRLKILHLAHNNISMMLDKDMSRLAMLQELNISSNKLRYLPLCLGRHPRLQVLKANSNLLKTLPDFRNSPLLKVLDVGSNRLVDVSMTNLMASQVNLLDISGNPNISVNSKELEGLRMNKKVCMIDMRGQNRSLLDLRTAHLDNAEVPWFSGFSQTSGIRNKLSVSVINTPKYKERSEGLFCVIDGGRNDEVPKVLTKRLPSIIEDEINNSLTRDRYLKYSLLSAHRKLKSVGQKLGASVAVCHITKKEDNGEVLLNIANTGDVEAILCRHGKAERLSRLFTVLKDTEETARIYKSDGIITEDGKINGVTQKTRLVGCSYLFPQLIPDAHTTTVSLHQEDQMVVIGNQGLWEYVSYQEAVDEVLDIPDPVVAAKRLQDLAQGYGSKENIAILVIRLLLTAEERDRMKSIVRTQLEFEQNALMFLESVPPASENIYGSDVNFTDSLARKVLDGKKRVKHHSKEVPIKPLPNQRYRKKEALSEWENILQKRIVDEVKFRELVSTFSNSDMDVEVGSEHDVSSNWSTLDREGKQNEDDVIIQPLPGLPTTAYPPPPPVWDEAGVYDSVEDFKRNRHLYPRNIDRDAVLFYQMQQARKAQTDSTSSLSSIQSDPMGPTSFKYPPTCSKTGSHSIEVLVRSPSLQGQGRHGGSKIRTVTMPSSTTDEERDEKHNADFDFDPICSSSARDCDNDVSDNKERTSPLQNDSDDKQVEEIQIPVEDSDTDTSVDSKTSVETVRRRSPGLKEVIAALETPCTEKAHEYRSDNDCEDAGLLDFIIEPSDEVSLPPNRHSNDHSFHRLDEDHYSIIEIREDDTDGVSDAELADRNVLDLNIEDEGPYATVCVIDGVITTMPPGRGELVNGKDTNAHTRDDIQPMVWPGEDVVITPSEELLNGNLGDINSATCLDEGNNGLDYVYSAVIKSTKLKQAPLPRTRDEEQSSPAQLTDDKPQGGTNNHLVQQSEVTEQEEREYTYSVISKSAKKKLAPKPPSPETPPKVRPRRDTPPSVSEAPPAACRAKQSDYLHCVQANQNKKDSKPPIIRKDSSPLSENKLKPPAMESSSKTSQEITPDDFYLKDNYFHFTKTPNVLHMPPTTRDIDNNVAIKAAQRPLSPNSDKEIFPWNESSSGHTVKRPDKRTLFAELDVNSNSVTSSGDLLANVVDLDDISTERESKDQRNRTSQDKVSKEVAFL